MLLLEMQASLDDPTEANKCCIDIHFEINYLHILVALNQNCHHESFVK